MRKMIDFLTVKPMSSKRKGCSRHRGEEDRISLLPDPLLCQILSNLTTKDAVKTSLLSTRWRSIWLSVPGMDLDDQDFPNSNDFVSFVDRFVGFSVDSPIEKLKLTAKREKSNLLAIKSWVDAAVKRKIRHLEINIAKSSFGFELLSVDIFTCQTLECLRIRFVVLCDFNRVSLPCLKTMHLEDVGFVNHAAVETLIASCPVLEDLSIIRSQDDDEDLRIIRSQDYDDVTVFRVCSQTIKRLNLVLDVPGPGHFRSSIDNSEVVVDAPRLEYLSLRDNQSVRFTIVNSLYSSCEVDVAVDFNVKDSLDTNDSAKRSSIGGFLTRISNVRDMTICWKTLKVIRQHCKLEPLPQFCYMSRLHAKIFAADLEMLPDLLESCPNLNSIVLELNGSIKKEEEISFSSSVPWCLRSSLERVEMRKPIGGFGVEMKLIRYFLENSTVLKKLTLRLGCPRMKQESIIFMELLRFRRCSSACEVDVVGLEETLMKL